MPSIYDFFDDARPIDIRVVKKTPRHPYYGRGSSWGYVVDGKGEGATLSLARGRRYVLDVRTGGDGDQSFPLHIVTSQDEDARPLTVPPVADDSFVLDTSSLPDLCYYECGDADHNYMGGIIVVARPSCVPLPAIAACVIS